MSFSKQIREQRLFIKLLGRMLGRWRVGACMCSKRSIAEYAVTYLTLVGDDWWLFAQHWALGSPAQFSWTFLHEYFRSRDSVSAETLSILLCKLGFHGRAKGTEKKNCIVTHKRPAADPENENVYMVASSNKRRYSQLHLLWYMWQYFACAYEQINVGRLVSCWGGEMKVK